jgi:hypothetical protein
VCIISDPIPDPILLPEACKPLDKKQQMRTRSASKSTPFFKRASSMDVNMDKKYALTPTQVNISGSSMACSVGACLV